jgi:prepilin signal peptidase PulO-like enzyme (type II secretory pathway)
MGPRAARNGLLVTTAALAAPPVAWLVQLAGLSLIGEVACGEAHGVTLPGGAVEAMWLVVSAITGLVAAAGLLVAFRRSRRHPGTEAAGDGDVRFLARLGTLSGALFLATILMGATAPAFLAC